MPHYSRRHSSRDGLSSDAEPLNIFDRFCSRQQSLVDLIDKEPWSALSSDVKGDIYEGLLEKNAQDTKFASYAHI